MGRSAGNDDESEARDDLGDLGKLGLRVLASVFSAIGFLGIVAFTGGAILWTRFYAAELPADQAVSVVPRNHLISLGATYLFAFAVIGVAVVLFVYILDPWGEPSGYTQFGLLLVAIVGLLLALNQTGVDRGPRFFVGAIALGVAAIITFLALRNREVDALRKGEFRAADLRRSRSREQSRRWTSGRIGGLTVAAALLVLAGALIDQNWFRAIVATTVVLFIANLLIADTTGARFLWYGAAVFLSVAVFGAVFQTARTLDAEKLQAAAVLRTNDPPGGGVAGFFVAETSDRVYLGRVDCTRAPNGRVRAKDGSGRLLWIPTDQVAAMSLGPLEGVEPALRRAPVLLAELQELQIHQPPGTAPSEPAAVVQPQPGSRPEEPPRRRLFGACVLPSQQWPPPLGGRPVDGERAFEIATTFRPILRFDTTERWRPIGVDNLLRESFAERAIPRHRVCFGSARILAACTEVSNVKDLEAVVGRSSDADKGHLDLSGEDVDRYCAPRECGGVPADCDACDSSAIYYRVVEANARFYIDYWWFLRFNHVRVGSTERTVCRAIRKPPRCFDHEGDWEGISVVTTSSRPPRLEAATFGTHEKLIRHRPPELLAAGQRPVVYVAAGTHAAYAQACPRQSSTRAKCHQQFRRFGRFYPEGPHDGRRPWGRNPDAACFTGEPCLRPFPASLSAPGRSWNDWSGRWGDCEAAPACRFGEGPVAPGHQLRFKNPSCFHIPAPRRCDPPVAAPAVSES